MDDQVDGVYGVAKDMTEARQMQEEIKEKNEELEAFWNYSIDPVFLLNNSGEIQRVNPAFEKTFGFCEEEVLRNRHLITPPNMTEDTKMIDDKISKGEPIALYETTRITKTGKILDILASYTPIRDNYGRVTGSTAFYKDITDLKKANKELHESEEKYRIITENAFDVIQLINPSGEVKYVSPSNEKILGYSGSERIGYSYLSNIHPEDVPLVKEGFQCLLAGDESVTLEIRVRHRDRYYIWLEITATPVVEDGKVEQMVLVGRDITDRKKLRDELERMAYIDPLSGLPNRRVFDEQLQAAFEVADSTNKKVAVMMMDGRKFKQINDTYGHDAGDAVIVETAKRVQQCLRESDTAARMGGDEMAIILPNIDSVKFAEEIATCIIQSLDPPLYFKGEEIQIGAGIGLAIYPDHTVRKKQLVKFADEALYKAKEFEWNAYQVYGEHLKD